MIDVNVPIEVGTLLKHDTTEQFGVVIEVYYFNDEEARRYDEVWLLKVLIDEKIEEGWLQDWDEWHTIE